MVEDCSCNNAKKICCMRLIGRVGICWKEVSEKCVSEYNMKHRTKDIVQLEIACAYHHEQCNSDGKRKNSSWEYGIDLTIQLVHAMLPFLLKGLLCYLEKNNCTGPSLLFNQKGKRKRSNYTINLINQMQCCSEHFRVEGKQHSK